MTSFEGNTHQEMGPQSTGSPGQPNLAAVDGAFTPTDRPNVLVSRSGIINPLVFARKILTFFKVQAPSGNVLTPEGSYFSYLSRASWYLGHAM